MSTLPNLLKQLADQVHPKFEIVIVNDRSSDGTYDYLREQKKHQANLKVVTVEHKPDQMDGKKYALTLGIKAAQYDNLVFTDGDCHVPDKNWLSQLSYFDSEDNIEINLGISLHKKGKGLLGLFIQFESLWTAIQYTCFAILGMPYMGVGRNLGYKKELFLNAKGFNAIMNIVGGDDDLFVNKHASRHNTAIRLGKEALTYTSSKKTWSDFFRQKLRHISVGAHYKWQHKAVLGLLSVSHLLFWGFMIYNLILFQNIMIITVALSIRTLFLYLAFIVANSKIGSTFPVWSLLFLDFI